MVPKTLAQAIKRWPCTDLGELLGLVAAELHERAEKQRAAAERSKGKRVDRRPSK